MEAKARASFALDKLLGALKWMVASGVATYILTELSKVIGEFEIDPGILLIINMVVNSTIFAIAKYRQGEE